MKHESDKTNDIKILKDETTFQSIYSKSYYPQELSEPLETINLLLIPMENFRDVTNPVFPEQTMDFFEFIKSNSPEAIVSEIAISDDDYKELELHADLVVLTTMVVEAIVFPLVVDLISNYIDQKIIRSSPSSKIKVNIKVVKGDNSIDVAYEGDADKFKQTIEGAKLLEWMMSTWTSNKYRIIFKSLMETN